MSSTDYFADQAAPATTTEKSITATLLTGIPRIRALPEFFGERHMLRTEMQIYHFMELLSDDYKGGSWLYFKLSNGGFYMAPEYPAEMNCAWSGNFFEGRMSADAAGITACLFAINMLANVTFEDRFSDLYYQLRDYACTHPEAALILRAID